MKEMSGTGTVASEPVQYHNINGRTVALFPSRQLRDPCQALQSLLVQQKAKLRVKAS
jgi:hypothetical protein